MSISTRVIRHRVKSIANTRKITKAMELVAASKMKRATNSLFLSRPYSTSAWSVVREIAGIADAALHPLLAKRDKIKKILCIVIASDRGLCGGFNAQVTKKAHEFIKNASAPIDVLTIGKKAEASMRRLGHNVIAIFPNLGHLTSSLDARPIAALAAEDYLKEIYDQVVIAYTDYRSPLVQKPTIFKLLPFGGKDISDETAANEEETPHHPAKAGGTGQGRNTSTKLGVGKKEEKREEKDNVENQNYNYEYLFEPSPQEVLNTLLPRMIEVQIYKAILESAASEHSARMMAMRSATDAARDMIDDLVFTMNQARQAAITREISEISAGRVALE